MSDFTTHLVAIGVGVVIALLIVGGSQKKEGSAAASTAAADAPAKTAAKKRNKKKNKKKAANSEPATTAASKPAPKPPAPKPKPPVKETPKEAPKEKAVAKAAPAPPQNGGKKNKNKNKKNGAASTTNGTPKTAPAPAPAPAPVVRPEPTFTPLQPRNVVEEAWATIPTKSKKKKNSKNQAAAAAASGTASAVPTETKASVSVTIDASRIGIIIGPKGATMNAIQEKTGTKLDVNAPKLEEAASGSGSQFRPVVGGKSKKSAKATVIITEGSPEAKQVAKKAILELADRGYATLLQAEGFGESSVGVHPRFLSELVGPGGSIIKAIQSELDVKLTIPKTDWTPKTMQVRTIQYDAML
jgi:hypothetical protein